MRYIQEKLKDAVQFVDLSQDEVYGEMFKDLDAGISKEKVLEDIGDIDENILNNYTLVPYSVNGKKLPLDFEIPSHYYAELDSQIETSKKSSKVMKKRMVKKPKERVVGVVKDDRYEPFFKKKKVGIPIPVIKNLMKSAGLDPSIIDSSECPTKEVEIPQYIPDPAYKEYFTLKDDNMDISKLKDSMKSAGLDPSIIDSSECPQILNPEYESNCYEMVEEEYEDEEVIDDEPIHAERSSSEELKKREEEERKKKEEEERKKKEEEERKRKEEEERKKKEEEERKKKEEEERKKREEEERKKKEEEERKKKEEEERKKKEEEEIKRLLPEKSAIKLSTPTKQLYWRKLEGKSVLSSPWMKVKDINTSFDTNEIEQIFGTSTKTVPIILPANPKPQTTKQYIDAKTKGKIEIPLMKLRLSGQQLRRAIYRCDFITFSENTTRVVRECLLTDEQFRLFSGPINPDELDLCDNFGYYMSTVPNIQDRIDVFYDRYTFKKLVEESIEQMKGIYNCFNYVLNDQNFIRVLKIILDLGNYLNCILLSSLSYFLGNSSRKGAYGFDLNSLGSIFNTKGNKGITFMEYMFFFSLY